MNIYNILYVLFIVVKYIPIHLTSHYQFRPPIALRTDLSHITTELWEIPVLRMAHQFYI